MLSEFHEYTAASILYASEPKENLDGPITAL